MASAFERGRLAETVAAGYLQAQGYVIAERNWRTRWCEIDIVATLQQKVVLVEVKYRQSPEWGAGLEYITSKKLQQMHFAAQFWCHTHAWQGDYTLGALEVTGNDFTITEWLSDIEA